MSSFDASSTRDACEIALTTIRALTEAEMDRTPHLVSEWRLILSPMVLICGQSGGHPPNRLRMIEIQIVRLPHGCQTIG